MNAWQLPNGHLLIPHRLDGPDGQIGDGMVEIGPDDPSYQDWLPFAEPPREGIGRVEPAVEEAQP